MPKESSSPEVRAIPRSFFRTPLCSDIDQMKADIGFLGVPFDQGAGTFRRAGSRSGPDGLRNLQSGVYDYMDLYEDKEGAGFFDMDEQRVFLRGVTMTDCGNVTILAGNVEDNFQKITSAVHRILGRGAFPVIIGGDHSITFPCIRAFEDHEPLDIVHFDAHQDFSPGKQGVMFSGGTPIRRASELPFVRNITTLGVRSGSEQVFKDAQAWGVKYVTTRQLQSLGPEAAAAQVPQAENIYLTIDVDVLDPAYAPGTGVPVAGGLTFYELRDTIRAVAARGRIVGMDIVEFAPDYDNSQITGWAIAKLTCDILAILFPSKENAVK
jgi:agmatinase